jgi:hypothetical protein
MLRYFCLCSSYSIASYSQLLHSTAFINLLSLLSMATDLSNHSLNSLSTDTHLYFEYKIFKDRTIFPSIINSRIRERLGTPHVSLSFAPVCSSFKSHSSFFENTEYTKKNPSAPFPTIPDSSNFIYEPLTHLQGYISPKHADHFIWEFKVFTEGLKVILGDELGLARITRVVGVGQNFIKFGVDAFGSSSKGEIPVQRMIVSFSPGTFHLTCIQRLKLLFFRRFLKSVRDFANENRVWDESEVGGHQVYARCGMHWYDSLS